MLQHEHDGPWDEDYELATHGNSVAVRPRPGFSNQPQNKPKAVTASVDTDQRTGFSDSWPKTPVKTCTKSVCVNDSKAKKQKALYGGLDPDAWLDAQGLDWPE